MPAKTVIVIAGPTAVGKTGIAIALAKRLETAIVSADSRQCYRGMMIGTAQPSPEEQAGVPHYFINEFPVTTDLTAADYERLALGYLDHIFKTRDTAIVCGGTGLYIKALCEGLDEMPATREEIVREVNEAYRLNGLGWLQEQLQQLDPAFLAQTDVNNPARLLRALIFKLSTGESILDYRAGAQKERPFRIIKIGLELPRELLYARINHRVDIMMQQGFLAEAQLFFPQRHLKNLQTVGYTELFDHLEGKTTLEEAVMLIKQHTRNYAKRQMTWFRKDSDLLWLRADDPDICDKLWAVGHRS